MRDPHVVALYYRLETDSSLTFGQPPPLEHDIDEITLHLADGVLTCTMKAHYALADEARAVVDPLLRAWELDEALRYGRRDLWFTFDKADIVDRNPPPPGTSLVIRPTPVKVRVTAGSVVVRLTRPTYPPPPAHFTVSPDVETLWHRYEGYQQGREPLLGMAYACLTWLEAQGGGRRNVVRRYAIDLAVLSRLGEFTANLGNERTARKFHVQGTGRPPTPQETTWIDAAIRLLIRRVGEYAAAPTASWPTLSMRDLPPL